MVRALRHLAIAIAISKVAAAGPFPGNDTPLACSSGARVRLPLKAPGEPRRLDVLSSSVRITLEGFRASRTKGKWLPVQDHTPLGVANESSESMRLTDICSHPKGPAPRVTFAVKGPYLGYVLSECTPSGIDAIEITVRCAAEQ